MLKKRKWIFFMFRIGLLVMFVVTVGSWVCGYERICGFEVPLGHDSAFRIWSCYGIITAGKYESPIETPHLHLYSEDPIICDRYVMMLRSVGIKLETLRERDSFKLESRSFELRGRRWSQTTVSFPHWLLAMLFATPLLWYLFMWLFRRSGVKRRSGGSGEVPGTEHLIE